MDCSENSAVKGRIDAEYAEVLEDGSTVFHTIGEDDEVLLTGGALHGIITVLCDDRAALFQEVRRKQANYALAVEIVDNLIQTHGQTLSNRVREDLIGVRAKIAGLM